MKKIILAVAVIALPFLFSGCGKKVANVEKVPEQTAQQGNNNNVALSENTTASENKEVPLPQGDDVVRLFFSLINEKKFPKRWRCLTR